MNPGNKIIEESKQGEALLMKNSKANSGKKLFLESYGCQMNFSDSEIVASILMEKGFTTTQNYEEADIIFVNTCAIRENAEQKVRNRLNDFKRVKLKNPKALVGVLGCMAERLKEQFLEQEKLVDIVVGPDSYRDLPNLIEEAGDGRKAINVLLSKEETYADLTPVRFGSNGVTAFISITRGCDNMCSFCVVPFTRGRERSRDPESIVKEAKEAFDAGFREVTLLGQNVDSYIWSGGGLKKEILNEEQKSKSVNFAKLLGMVAAIDPDLRVRFSTSHPKDLTDEVIETIAKHENICKHIHLPVQSGNSRILEMMNRGYTREWYLERIASIKRIIPDCGISMDIITGFCSETEEEHKDTLSLMEAVKYDFGYMFMYSERPKTLAERKYKDDVPEPVKKRRIQEIVDLQRLHSGIRTEEGLGKTHRVLIEGFSKKSEEMLMGRNSQNAVVVFSKGDHKKGDYVNVFVDTCTSSTLIGKVVEGS